MGVLTALRGSRAWWSGAALAPILIHAVARAANANALFVDSIVIVIAGPIVGVIAATNRANPRNDTGALVLRLCQWTATFATVAAFAAVLAAPSGTASSLIAAYLTLGVAALAVSAVGAASAVCFDHSLDATSCALLLSLTASFGVLVAGPLVADASTSMVNAALLASPIVATASAANIDVFRGDLLYRFSPIAHSQFEYPAWPTACLAYAAVAAFAFFIVMRFHHSGRTLAAERKTV
jgi:hypothetical protein